MAREIAVDALKGIGISAVVLAHITYNPVLATTIFMFHMPLFFLLGGWLHNTNVPPMQFLASKARSLLVPYCCFLVLLWPLELLVSHPGQSWNAAWVAGDVLVPMLAGGPLLTGFASVFWFVTCYFLTQQLMHFLLRRYALRHCALICGAMLACAYVNAALLPQWWLPWDANVVLIAAPIYLIGHVARHSGLPQATPLTVALLLIVALVAVVLNVTNATDIAVVAEVTKDVLGAGNAIELNAAGAGNTMDMKVGEYGIPLVTLAGALAITALLALLAVAVQRRWPGRMLAEIGRASMTIMFLHQFVQLTMAKMMGITQALPRIALALLLCWLAHGWLKKSPLMARLFLGVRPAPETIRG